MPRSLLFCILVLAGCLLLPCLAQARDQAPAWVTEAMAEPLDPAEDRVAVAELLDYERVEFLEKGRLRHVLRGVLRLNDENGQLASFCSHVFQMDSEKILKAQAWVIDPDGAMHAFGRRDFNEAVVQQNQYYWTSQRKIIFDKTERVKTGGFLAWEYEVDEAVGPWGAQAGFRSSHRIAHVVFEAVPLSGSRLVSEAVGAEVPQPVAGGTPGSLRWEKREVRGWPKQVPVGFMPSPAQLWVRCPQKDQPMSLLETWADFGGFLDQLYATRIVTDDAVAAKARELVAGIDDHWERVRALAAYAQKQIMYLALSPDKDVLAGIRPRAPSEVLNTKLGDCKDKATLFCSLLQAVGEKGYVVIVHSGNPQAVRRDRPFVSFNHAIAAIPVLGEVPPDWPVVQHPKLGTLVLFDPTDPSTPFGALPAQDQGGLGLVISSSSEDLSQLPAETPSQRLLTRRLTAKVDDKGTIRVDASEAQTGAQGARAHYARVMMGDTRAKVVIETALNAALPSFKDLSWREEWDEKERCSRTLYSVTCDNFLRVAGGGLYLLKPALFPLTQRLVEWKPKLNGSVWQPASSLDDELRFEIPEALELESKPSDLHVEGDGLRCDLNYRVEGRVLVYTCRFSQQSAFLERDTYDRIRQQTQKVTDAAKRPFLLRRKLASVDHGP